MAFSASGAILGSAHPEVSSLPIPHRLASQTDRGATPSVVLSCNPLSGTQSVLLRSTPARQQCRAALDESSPKHRIQDLDKEVKGLSLL